MRTVTVGIVDDNKEFCNVLNEYFGREENIAVSWMAADGEEAVEKLEKELPDVLLLDIIMPKLDGLGVLEKISSIPGASNRNLSYTKPLDWAQNIIL